jgi:endonuclease/exonuclease/phosphatase family metal-dependent hydrolase
MNDYEFVTAVSQTGNRRRMKYRRWMIVAGGILGAFAGFVPWAAGRIPDGGEIITIEVPDGSPAVLETGEEVTVATWNIHYGGGPTLEVGRGQSRAEVVENLDAIAAEIRSWDADIVALQEVDRSAIRSYDIDQLAWLQRATGMPYAVWTPTWDARWVPHPGLNPKMHIGRVLSGQAILSRYPLTAAQHVRLPQPEQAGTLYNSFYLHRHLTEVTAQLGPAVNLRIINAHLEAFEPVNRMDHADRTVAAVNPATPHTVLLGDMNCTPTEAAVRQSFPDEPGTDMSRDDTIDRLRKIPGLQEVVPPSVYAAAESAWFTFPAHAPNRRLDYIFHGESLVLATATVPRMDQPPSDHLPVVARFRID